MAAKKNTARIDLDVPFRARKAAKAYGAYWDRVKKVWYTYAGHHNLEWFIRFMNDEDRAKYAQPTA